MTGLNLETFLRLIRADLGTWLSLAVVAVILALMTWTSWGSRRALRKCLFLSIAAHVGIIVYGSSSPEVLKALRLDASAKKPDRAEKSVRITPVPADRQEKGPDGSTARKVAEWDRDRGPLALAEPARLVPAPLNEPSPSTSPRPVRPDLPTMAATGAVPEVKAATPPVTIPAPTPEARSAEAPPVVAPGDPEEVAAPSAVGSAPTDAPAPTIARVRPGPPASNIPRTRPNPPVVAANLPEPPIPVVPDPGSITPPPLRPEKVPSPKVAANPGENSTATPTEDLDPGPTVAAPPSVATPSPGSDSPTPEVRRVPRPAREPNSPARPPTLGGPASLSNPLEVARVTPAGPSSVSTLTRPSARWSLANVPPVYRSRLDPNRTALAQRAGASLASEQAVERALDWLARHQDAADGRWNGGTKRGREGHPVDNDESFTMHCPAGETCVGECRYWDADTALTGLSLLAYLGAGYTHMDGKYAPVVARGLEFLLQSQKPDGDLRGESRGVGMYCHSMATLALCEAFALTGDSRLKGPTERAVGFLVGARARDGLSWRYLPGAPDGDTSILGWAVMALKSAKAVGLPIAPNIQSGIFAWLNKVSQGKDGGLAIYNFEPGQESVTPTMTAEAWACRQFLEVGGPGRASDEAAAFLLRNKTDRGEFNIYYLYYGTLAMYQHGGPSWSAWNARVRDDVVRRQRVQGHTAGSWDPDDSVYGQMGGRIYSTALATLTLEVYYRFLRLYDPSTPAPAPSRPAGNDPGARRAGLDPSKPGP